MNRPGHVDVFTGRFEPGEKVVHGYLPNLAIYTIESVHPGGLRMRDAEGQLHEARVESMGFFGPDREEVFGIRDLWLVSE